MQATAVLVSLTLTLTASAQSASAPAPTRPPHLSAGSWMPITQNLGFVIERPASRENVGSTESVLGYFAARRDGHWLRLDSIPQTASLRWPLTSGSERPRVTVADNLAFVMEQPAVGGANGQPSAAIGYFVAKHEGRWVRLDPLAHGALFDGPLTTRRSAKPSVPITATFSFAIEQPATTNSDALLPAALGYFVVNQGGHRLRLSPIGSGTLFRQPSSPGE